MVGGHQPMYAYARTNVETPHVLETPSIIAAAKNPRHVVGEGDRVRAEAVGGERPPDGGALLQYITGGGASSTFCAFGR
jgi:hypothetical protein